MISSFKEYDLRKSYFELTTFLDLKYYLPLERFSDSRFGVSHREKILSRCVVGVFEKTKQEWTSYFLYWIFEREIRADT